MVALLAIFMGADPRTWELEEEVNPELKLRDVPDGEIPQFLIKRDHVRKREGVVVDATEKKLVLRIPMASRYS